MRSLVVLMIETEQPESLSARKLVVETAKHNVITAYDPDEGMDLLRRFPAVDAVMVHGGLLLKNPDLLTRIRTQEPTVPIILATPFEDQSFPEATWIIDSHQPHAPLQVLCDDLQASSRN